MRLLVAGAAATLFICGVAQAQAPNMPSANGDTVVGVGMICNTPDQAKRFIDLQVKGSEPHAAMNTVNAEARDARACGVAAVAFIRDQTVDTETMHNKLVHVVRINIVAGFDGHGWQPVSNMTQYAVIEDNGGETI